MNILFTDTDAVEVTLEDGRVLTCFRTNMDGSWHPDWIREKASADMLTPEIEAAINNVAWPVEDASSLAFRTRDAYMAAFYGPEHWKKIAAFLLRRYSAEEAEEIMRSKHMRWASDSGGRATFTSFQKYYLSYHDPGAWDIEVRNLMNSR